MVKLRNLSCQYLSLYIYIYIYNAKKEDIFLRILIHFCNVVSIIDNLTYVKVMIFGITQVAKNLCI